MLHFTQLIIFLLQVVLKYTFYNVHEGRISKHLSDSFPIQNGLKQGDAVSPLLSNFDLEYAIRKVQEYLVN
jgi:hypothetical protein